MPCRTAATLHLKVLVSYCVTKTKTVTEYVFETQNIGGMNVKVKVPVTKTVAYVECLGKWEPKELNLADPGISAHDTEGKSIAKSDLADRLTRDTVVLMSMDKPVDPFFLSTVKEGTIILVVPQNLIVPPPMVAPPAPPTIPAPPRP